MAHKKCEHEDQGESAPLWIISFADLVTLMLSFFVILSAGNSKDVGMDAEFAKIVAALKMAFNNMSPAEAAALDAQLLDFDQLAANIQALARKEASKHRGDSDEKGLYGNSFRVRRLRDGMEITMGGPIFFEPFSARLTDDGTQALEQIGDMVKGHRNMIEIRGHAGDEPPPADWTFSDAMKLSYARAEQVANGLAARGIDRRAVRLVAVGANEPIAREVYDPTKRGLNRRVEIIVRESLIDDYVGQAPVSTSPATQPAASRPAP